ncbi:DUF4012 domain-containing protein [Pseudarthrobacter oxydans]|uniref:DUF4012 domain-containing protein n=1 Tax=Pseudarthrobacter oxydans TaxID=1671 RepID=UPI003810BDB4
MSVLVILIAAWAVWLGAKAMVVRDELNAATQLVPQLKRELASSDAQAAEQTTKLIAAHTSVAKETAGQPLWTLASVLPWLGANTSAVAEVARTADDVAQLGLTPLVKVYGSLNWDTLLPSSNGSDIAPLQAASPRLSSAAHAVRASSQRLSAIDKDQLLPQIAQPLSTATSELNQATGALDAAARASNILPALLGSQGTRNYLLIIQNNAESRASGGIPGALAVLTVDAGRLSLAAQSSAGDVGVMSPLISVDAVQQQIYSRRLGKFMQDVNLTPDFPTSASTAQAMWERKTGQRVDGVISIDPVALSYILQATGPIQVAGTAQAVLSGLGLPDELNDQNVVHSLLSDVYLKIPQPELQDAYFAAVAREIFVALSDGKADSKRLMSGITRATDEGRVLVWSDHITEQSVIAQYALSGAVDGPSISPAQFGVYFNDGTGAKMDYYVKRTVQLIKECPRDGYEETTVRITSTNTAPADAATSLPAYVTGDGNFGVPPGSVQTNIVSYGPAQAHVETAKLDGQKTEFAPYFHGNRPVGVLAIRLAPGESKTVDFTFGKIVQHTEPNVVVTPTVQDVKDVTLPTETAPCG